MTSDNPTYDVGKLDDRLRTLEQRFAWGVGAAGAIGLIALLSGGFTTYMLNNAEGLGSQVAAIERTVGGIDGTVSQALGRIEGAQATAEMTLSTALNRATGEIEAREASAMAAIDEKAAEAIDAEWQEAISRLHKIETAMVTAVVGFDSQIGCPDGWSAFDQAPVVFGLDTSGLEPAFDQIMARLGVIWCKQA